MGSDLGLDLNGGGVLEEPTGPPAPIEPDQGWGGEIVPLHDDPTFTHFEYGPSMTLVDSDYSGFWNQAVIDVDGNGVPNIIASVQGAGVIVMVDEHGDGHFEGTEYLTHDQLEEIAPELADLLAPQLAFVPSGDDAFTPIDIDHEALVSESPYWFEQAANGLCVPASIAQIVAEYTGVPFENEAAFVELANEYGLFWVGPDGVPAMGAEGALFLLEQAGVPASMIVSANLDMLDAYVDAGHGVVLAVSSNEVWYGEPGGGAADHALVISDIDREAGVAVLADPGHPEGNGFIVPLEVLEEAWAAGGNTMIVAEQPADGSLVEGVPGVGDGRGATQEPFTVAALDTSEEAEPHSQGEGIVLPGLTGEGLPATGLPLGGDSTTPQLHTTAAQAAAWAARRPWVLLPVAIAAGRLVGR